MIRKIPVGRLTVGMYVHDVNCEKSSLPSFIDDVQKARTPDRLREGPGTIPATQSKCMVTRFIRSHYHGFTAVANSNGGGLFR